MTWFMDPMPNKRKPSTHRVYMHYLCRKGYQISFLEADLKTALKRKLTFLTADKILEMQERWGEDRSEAYRGDLERQIAMGRPGGVWLILSTEQYAKLNK